MIDTSAAWEAADNARGEQAYLASDVFDLCNEIDLLRAESQRYREALESIEGLTMSMVVHSNAFVSTMKSIARTALKGGE